METKELKTGEPLFKGADWDFDALRRVHDAGAVVAKEMGLSTYPIRIEIITSEQMLDAYSSIGVPIMYKHWSFGKRFVHDEALYRKGIQGLAYEIVINTDPCIVYIMEENTMTMQALVILHAGFGHNHFFKNNGLFREWTDASGIIDYLIFARDYIAKCEEVHGFKAVERILDAAHALKSHGVNRVKRPRDLSLKQEEAKLKERMATIEREYNDLWQKTIPGFQKKDASVKSIEDRQKKLGLPEENLLYFLEKRSPKLKDWEREILRIIRNIEQYFYPQRQTKVMNEGCATYVHHKMMHRLHDMGMLTDGTMLEFFHVHSNVIRQADAFNPQDRRTWIINPYALGFAMMQDIERIATEPTLEDREWFPDFAGNMDPMGTLRYAWKEFRDESFIQQFLSPHIIRKFGFFKFDDFSEAPKYRIDAIHNERGYKKIRQELARTHDISYMEPDIQIVDVDLDGDRELILEHRPYNGLLLHEKETERVLLHLARLWGYAVKLQEVAEDGSILATHLSSPLQN